MINRIFFQQNFLGKRFAFLFALACALSFTACGGDSGSSASDEEVLSSSDKLASSSSSAKSSSSDKPASSSSTVESSSSDKPASSSSTVESSSSSDKPASSSSSVKSSSSAKLASSSSTVESSSSDKPASSSSAKISSSSEYVPFDHSVVLAGDYHFGGNPYKTFTDERNGRSYYYMTFKSSLTGDSVTVMAENLNIGEMVPGAEDQTDDTKIERYCYNNDTTKCDEFGGLYQWAEMMQLPSRCNTESCSDLIQENHQGICPDGWRLFTYEDYLVVWGYDDEFGHGIAGLRATQFSGYNDSGFSLVGAGKREQDGKFVRLTEVAYWYYPAEHEYDVASYALFAYIATSSSGAQKNNGDEKTYGLSVRCTKLETEPVFHPE